MLGSFAKHRIRMRSLISSHPRRSTSRVSIISNVTPCSGSFDWWFGLGSSSGLFTLFYSPERRRTPTWMGFTKLGGSEVGTTGGLFGCPLWPLPSKITTYFPVNDPLVLALRELRYFPVEENPARYRQLSWLNCSLKLAGSPVSSGHA